MTSGRTMYSKLILFLIVAALGSGQALAYKVRLYDFAEQALQAQAIVVARVLEPAGSTLRLSVREYVLGSGPAELDVGYSVAFRGSPPSAAGGDRLVFLESGPRGYALFGAGSQAIWPQDDRQIGDRGPLAGETDLELLETLARQIRGILDFRDPPQSRRWLSDMLRNPTPFARFAGLRLCLHLHGLNPDKYRRLLDLCAAHALENLDGQNPDLLSAAMDLLDLAPESAALRKLLGLTGNGTLAPAMQNAAFLKFSEMTETQGEFDFQSDTLSPDEPLRRNALTAMHAWFAAYFPIVFFWDYPTILEALTSEDESTRAAGKVFLRAATGKDFGFDEAAPPSAREAALREIEAWRRTLYSS